MKLKISPVFFPISFMALVSIFGYQNCGNFKAIQFEVLPLSSSFFAKDCLSNSIYQNCVFYKSPVFQPEGPLKAEQISKPNYSELLTFPIAIPNDANPTLPNSNFIVLKKAEIPDALVNMDKNELASKPDQIAFLMSWYWGGQVTQFINGTGQIELLQKSLRIVPMASETGYSSGSNAILLGGKTTSEPRAFDASLLVHLMGQAMIYSASGDQIKTDLGQEHEACGVLGEAAIDMACCRSNRGCSKAIMSGLSDYLVAVVFPNHTGVGEFFGRAPGGMNLCGASRNVGEMRSINALHAYNICGQMGLPGEVSSMGSYYGSLWYGVRQRISSDPERLRRFDQFYVKSFYLIQGADTFETFSMKLTDLDQLDFGGEFMPFFEEELQARSAYSE